MDFPAAHSMDTRWFGVDDAGQVATLFSGETGPVPRAWQGGQDSGYDWVARLLAVGMPLDLSAYAALPPDPQIRRFADGEPAQDWEQHFELLLRLSHPRLRDLWPAASQLPSATDTRPGSFLYVPHLRETERLQQLLQRGLVERAWARCELAVLLGFHAFSWREGREGTPTRPLSQADLPDEMAAQLVRLPGLTFAGAPYVDPDAVVPCRWWDR
jgi:hypothetical protein